MFRLSSEFFFVLIIVSFSCIFFFNFNGYSFWGFRIYSLSCNVFVLFILFQFFDTKILIQNRTSYNTCVCTNMLSLLSRCLGRVLRPDRSSTYHPPPYHLVTERWRLQLKKKEQTNILIPPLPKKRSKVRRGGGCLCAYLPSSDPRALRNGTYITTCK